MKVLVMLFAMCLSASAFSAPTADQTKFLAYLKSGKEKKVKDAVWATDRNLYVGMLNDGTSRNGFAEYLCEVATADFGIKPNLIKIVDVVRVQKEGKFVELGKANCR